MYYRGSKPGHALGSHKQQCAAEGRARIWQAVRVMRRFKVADIEMATELKNGAIGLFLRTLARAGYLQVVFKARGLRPTVYQLVRDSGPLPPMRRTDGSGMWDQNTQQLYPLRKAATARGGDTAKPAPEAEEARSA